MPLYRDMIKIGRNKMKFKFNPEDYCKYLECDLKNLYDKCNAYYKNKCDLTCLEVENAYERFFFGLKSCDVKMNYRDIDLIDLKEYCYKLKNIIINDYATIQSKQY